jgi:hypothetical protein
MNVQELCAKYSNLWSSYFIILGRELSDDPYDIVSEFICVGRLCFTCNILILACSLDAIFSLFAARRLSDLAACRLFSASSAACRSCFLQALAFSNSINAFSRFSSSSIFLFSFLKISSSFSSCSARSIISFLACAFFFSAALCFRSMELIRTEYSSSILSVSATKSTRNGLLLELDVLLDWFELGDVYGTSDMGPNNVRE